MKIYKITNQHRRDFEAILVCEHCDNTQILESGYDDDYFHCNVIPKIPCEKCGKVAGDNYTPNKTKYAAWEVI